MDSDLKFSKFPPLCQFPLSLLNEDLIICIFQHCEIIGFTLKVVASIFMPYEFYYDFETIYISSLFISKHFYFLFEFYPSISSFISS